MPSRDAVADLIAQARTYDLEMPEDFFLAPLDAVQAVYNGIGPDWLPARIRNWLTEHFEYFAAGAMIHDWEYEHTQDRSLKGFTDANERLRRNCKKLLAKGYPWYKRILYRNRPDVLASACQEFGWGAWQNGTHPQG